MSRVLLTGATGYLGSRILMALIQDPDVETIVATTRLRPGVETEKTTWLQGDLATLRLLSALTEYRIDTIIHTAWDMAATTNVAVTEHVADAAVQSRTVERILCLSSAAVYGTHEDAVPCTEKDSLVSGYRGPYGEQKVAAEQVITNAVIKSSRPIDTSVLRPVGVYRVLPFLMHLNRYLPFPAPHAIFRQFVHEQDVVDAVLACMKVSPKRNERIHIYNLAPPPIPLFRFYVPEKIVRLIFSLIWKMGGYERARPGKWRLYLYPPLVEGTKGCELLGGSYRTIPYR